MSTRKRLSFRACCVTLTFASASFIACHWDPSKPFEREAPEVREALSHLDGGDAATAGDLLTQYLSTGHCKEGNIGTPSRVRERSNGTFDLGLAFFRLGETFGKRFGEEEIESAAKDETQKALRAEQVDCALKLVRAVATDDTQPVDLRARARYVEGNLLVLTQAYEEAVRAYDAALELAPGMHDSGPITVGNDSGTAYTPDMLGVDAAWNRAIALRRVEDKKDAGKDASDEGGDAGDSGAPSDSGGGNKDSDAQSDPDGGSSSPDASPPDAGRDAGGGNDASAPDSGAPDQAKQPKPESANPKPTRQNQDDRMLDQLENAPTVQQEVARKQAQRHKVRGTSDK
jgi:hypothetical protein